MHFCGVTPQATFTGTLTHQGKMVEKRVQRRGLLWSAQVSHNPTLPIISPFCSFPGSQDKSWTEAGSLPLADTNSVPQFWWLDVCFVPSPKFLHSSWPCSPTGCPSSYVLIYHRFSCFTSKFKVWEPASLQAPSQMGAQLGLFLRKSLPTAWARPPGTAAAHPQTHQGLIIFLDLPSLSPTLSRYHANFSDFLWMNISPKWTSEGRDIEIHFWAHGQHRFAPVGRSGVPSSQIQPNTEMWHYSLFLLGPCHELWKKCVPSANPKCSLFLATGWILKLLIVQKLLVKFIFKLSQSMIRESNVVFLKEILKRAYPVDSTM